MDLVKFRQSAAGDNLRVFYESLSKDPNSLSNLDQVISIPFCLQFSVLYFSVGIITEDNLLSTLTSNLICNTPTSVCSMKLIYWIQDLPNYAQHQVQIFSLPQQWLWCESWCGNATKSQAKTIDLCNNPMTKEPKLEVSDRLSIHCFIQQPVANLSFL